MSTDAERSAAEAAIKTIAEGRAKIEGYLDAAKAQQQEHLAAYRARFGGEMTDGAKIAPGKTSAEEKAAGVEGKLRVFYPVQRKG